MLIFTNLLQPISLMRIDLRPTMYQLDVYTTVLICTHCSVITVLYKKYALAA